MDQFSAHLDRGWDLIQRGDAVGAEASARRALELDSDSPEAYNLLGFVAALRGEYEEAREHYRQAIALDDTYLEAILNAAELHIHPLPDFEEAERLCDDALELVETDEERVDALLLKFDALLGQGRADAARDLCRRFPPPPYTNPAHAFLVGRAHYEVGDKKRAIPLIEESTRVTPDSAEAFYYLGLVRDEQGDEPASTRAFLRSRELDLDAPIASWALSPAAFQEAVAASIEGLDPELSAWLDPGDVYVTTLPGAEVVVDGVDPRALLMIDSVTDSDLDDPAEPESGRMRLFVYQRNIERIAGSVEQLVSEIRAALEAELSAYLGRATRADETLVQTH
jgi:Flp pilus assembly protein TadD